MRSTSIVVATLMLALTAPRASAQLVDPKDPCYETLFGSVPKPNVLTTGSWDNEVQVAQAATAIRLSVGMMLMGARAAEDKIKAGTYTPAERETLRARMRCLPWLATLLRRLEDEMKKLGIATVVMPEDRKRLERERFLKEAEADVAEAKQIMERILRSR